MTQCHWIWWLGHVLRMNQDCIAKTTLRWTPPGRRKQGRNLETYCDGWAKRDGLDVGQGTTSCEGPSYLGWRELSKARGSKQSKMTHSLTIKWWANVSSFDGGKYMFGVKDPIPGRLCSRVVYKFACGGCNACLGGEMVWHFSRRMKEHLASERVSHILKHLQNSEHWHALCSADCFQRDQSSMNQQLHHVNLKLSL